MEDIKKNSLQFITAKGLKIKLANKVFDKYGDTITIGLFMYKLNKYISKLDISSKMKELIYKVSFSEIKIEFPNFRNESRLSLIGIRNVTHIKRITHDNFRLEDFSYYEKSKNLIWNMFNMIQIDFVLLISVSLQSCIKDQTVLFTENEQGVYFNKRFNIKYLQLIYNNFMKHYVNPFALIVNNFKYISDLFEILYRNDLIMDTNLSENKIIKRIISNNTVYILKLEFIDKITSDVQRNIINEQFIFKQQ